MNELFKCGIRGKLYRLIYNLNKHTEIAVKTPVGVSSNADVGEVVGQGTNEGAIISAVNLSGGVSEYFEDSEKN